MLVALAAAGCFEDPTIEIRAERDNAMVLPLMILCGGEPGAECPPVGVEPTAVFSLEQDDAGVLERPILIYVDDETPSLLVKFSVDGASPLCVVIDVDAPPAPREIIATASTMATSAALTWCPQGGCEQPEPACVFPP